MTGYERVMNVLQGRAVDRVPVWPFVMQFSAKYAGVPYSKFCTDYKVLADTQIKVAEDFCLDAVVIDTDAYREASALGAVLRYPENDLPIMHKYAIENKANFPFALPSIEGSERLACKVDGIAYAKERLKNERIVCGWVEAPLQSAGTLYDINDFMMDMYEDPDFVDELMDFTAELGIKFALAQAEAGADIIGIGDAMASMISPATYEEQVIKYIDKLVRGIKAKSDVKIKYHICGNAVHILRAVKDIPFDIINIDYKIDAAEAYSIVSDGVCLKGNINPVTIEAGPAELLEAEVREIMNLKLPKFILSGGCEITSGTPHENLHKLVEISKSYAQ